MGPHGMYQHAAGSEPNPEFGYCLDDNARALIVVLRAHLLTRQPLLLQYAGRFLNFVERAQRPDGRFMNFMDAGGAWLEQVGSDDSNGRAVWALGFASRYAPDNTLRGRATRLLARAVPAIEAHTFLRAKAFSLIGLQHWLAVDPPAASVAIGLAADLAGAFEDCATKAWRWFEPELTYCNARLCEALIGTNFQHIGLMSLDWLCEIMECDGMLRLIGNRGWYRRDGTRAIFDQQPVDAAATSSACVTAYRATSEPRYARWARMAFDWFQGHNTTHERMVDDATGGCYDGLQPAGHNTNQGAESVLAWLLTQEDSLELAWLDS